MGEPREPAHDSAANAAADQADPVVQARSRRELHERKAAHAAGVASPPRRRDTPGPVYGFNDSKPKRKRRRWILAIVIPLVVIIVIGGGAAGAAWLLFPDQVRTALGLEEANDYAGGGVDDTVVVIKSGDLGSDIAKTLVDKGVTKSYAAFYDLIVATTPEPVFQPGAWGLKSKMSAQAALSALLDPTNKIEDKVVVPEGTAEVDVLDLVSEASDIPIDDLKAAAADVASFGLPAGASSLEGFLFPATYTFEPGTTAHDALQAMVNRSFQALDEAGVAVDDRYRVIDFASLVQREAGLKDDYYKVARVFQNRLDQGMLLQSDATVAYGTGNTHLVTTTDEERADANNAYNTYVHPGLPVAPISNPGDLAIDAVLHPADGSWLFFVTVNLETGETVFSNTEEEHEAAVDQWLAWMDDHPEYG